MNLLSLIFIFLGMTAAGVFAVGMDPYPCGLPLLLMAVAVLLGSWHRDQESRPRYVLAWIGLAVVYLGWRMVQSSLVDFARSDALLLVGVVLAFWWVAFCRKAAVFTHWLIGLWAIMIANVVVASLQAYYKVDVYQLLGERSTKEFPSGLYFHYNHFANFLLGGGLLSFGYGMAGKMKRPMRVVSLAMYAMSVYGVYLSHSRGAWLGLGCGSALVLVGWLANLWRTKTSWAGVALVAATVLAPLLVTGAWQVGSQAVSNRNNGDSGRLEFASIAVDLIQEKPVWGGGSRSFFYDSYAKWNAKELWVGSGDLQYAHNEYLQAAVDYGFVGLFLLLGVFVIVMFRGVALLTVSAAGLAGNAGIALGAMAALCAMGVQAFFSFVYHVLPDVILMGCCIGWLVREPWALQSEDKNAEKGYRFAWKQGVVGGIVALVAVFVAMRDAAAWLAMYPGMDFTRVQDSVKAERYRKALALRPDFRTMSDYTKILLDMNQDPEGNVEEKKARLEEAVIWQEAVIQRAPNSYPDLVNLALMYDAMGRFEEAQPLYEKVLPILDPREMYYGTRYFYARHLAAHANAVWRQRQPEKALVLFMRAKEQLSKATGSFREADPAVKLMIEKSIAFLQGANIQPEE
jgi:O-antigen ligase